MCYRHRRYRLAGFRFSFSQGTGDEERPADAIVGQGPPDLPEDTDQGHPLAAPAVAAPDVRSHAERLVSKRTSVSSSRVHPTELPNGAMVTFPIDESDRCAWLVQDGKLWRWSFAGYSPAMPVAAVKEADLITAPAIVATLVAGYRPHIHASARDGCMEHPLHATSLPPPLGTTMLPGDPRALPPELCLWKKHQCPPLVHDGTERHLVHAQNPAAQTDCEGGTKKDHTVKMASWSMSRLRSSELESVCIYQPRAHRE